MTIDTRTTKEAVYLIDEEYMVNAKNPVPSGWDADRRGAKDPLETKRGAYRRMETRDDGKYPLIMSRKFMPVRSGKASFRQIFRLNAGSGFNIEFFDLSENAVLTIEQKQDGFYAKNTKICDAPAGRVYTVSVEFDLDNKTAEISVNGDCLTSVSLNTDSLARLVLGYKDGYAGFSELIRTYLFINYLVCDECFVHRDGDMPYDWTNNCKDDSSAKISYYHEGQGFYNYVLTAKKGKTASVSHAFAKTGGVVCFELKYLTVNEDGEGVKLSLTNGGKECVTVLDNGTASKTTDGTVLRNHHPYVWQTLRIEADTKTSKAFIKHNGKKCTYIDFNEACDGFDGILISYSPDFDGVMKFTDIFVFEIQPEPDDYPKPPVLPTKRDDVYTGMNICSLWRTGSHYGWDNISCFKDNITYMGFYDEGLPEVADWEIKWMKEHGLDCEFYCWYANQKTAPMYDTHICDALHDGHFNAKYGDMMSFAIIWEAMNCVHPESVEQFKKFYIPYWIDYYFSDPRYFQIDGVAIMAAFGFHALMKDFGSAENIKACFDALREELKKIGYRDLAVIANVLPTEETMKAGIDGAYTYNWGHLSYDADYTKTRIEAQLANKQYGHVVPTVAVGYNDCAWREVDRFPMMTLEDMESVLKWMKDDVLGSYTDVDEAWKKKLLMFATWNEYGEGTYMCPAGLNGFGYVNEMRKIATVEGDCFESDRPSQASLDRLGYLHPKGRIALHCPLLAPVKVPSKLVKEIKITSQSDVDKWTPDNAVIRFEDGMMKGDVTERDPKLIIDVEIDTKDVSAIEIMLRSKENGENVSKARPMSSPWMIYFATEDKPEFDAERMLAQVLCETADGGALVSARRNVGWKGKITRIRIDPTSFSGAFEFEYIRFLGNEEEDLETYINDRKYDSHYPSKFCDGEWYVPFEPLRDFHLLTNLYYEWDDEERTLMIECDGKVSYWKENCDIVKFEGKEIKLKKPLEFYDNLPYLSLSVFCEVTGYKYTVKDNRLDIFTK